MLKDNEVLIGFCYLHFYARKIRMSGLVTYNPGCDRQAWISYNLFVRQLVKVVKSGVLHGFQVRTTIYIHA